MTLNLLFSCLYFAASLYFSLFEGVGFCLAVCYVPALLFFRPVEGYIIRAGIPDLTAANVAALAMLIGMAVRIGKKIPFRWTLMDTLVLLAPLLATLSTFYTENLDNSYENLHATYNEGMKQLFGWVIPYFAARAAFKSERVRVVLLWTLVWSMFILTPFALIEMRLWPQYYVQILGKLGLVANNDPMVMSRMGYFRAQVSFLHPIFFGDACLSMAVLVLLLAHTTAVGTRNLLVQLAAACATAELLASLSFGPYGGFVGALLVFALLYYGKKSRLLLVPLSIAAIVAMSAFTYYMATSDLPPRPTEASMADSFFIRRLIIHNSWPIMQTAGWLGHGRQLNLGELRLESVDNAYVLFVMCRGWLYTAVWIVIPLLVGWRAVRAIRAYSSSNVHVFPLALGTAGVMGVSAAFYGVWAGWSGEPYTMLWLITIGFTMTLCDLCFEAAALTRPPKRKASQILAQPQPVLARA